MGNDQEAARRPIRPLTLVLAVVVLVVVGALVVPRLVDPYRPGTTHDVTVQHVGCANGPDVRPDGHYWKSQSFAWDGIPNGTYHLTLDIISDEDAVLHLPNGAAARYVRQPDGAFSDLSCAIR